MDRRELFKTVAATVAASGVTLDASVMEAKDGKPALAIFECDRPISVETAARLAQHWEEGSKGTAFEGTKAYVLTDGLKLTLIDANGRVLNRKNESTPD